MTMDALLKSKAIAVIPDRLGKFTRDADDLFCQMYNQQLIEWCAFLIVHVILSAVMFIFVIFDYIIAE